MNVVAKARARLYRMVVKQRAMYKVPEVVRYRDFKL